MGLGLGLGLGCAAHLRDLGDGALDDGVEAEVPIGLPLGGEARGRGVDVRTQAHHLGVGLVDGAVDGVVLVGGVGGERGELEHLVRGRVRVRVKVRVRVRVRVRD